MTRRQLPIGLQTFRNLRERNCYYVDKTAHAHALLEGGTHYFLSRPRRFGKSLFLDTLKELFEGNEPLFAGLDIHDRWDWSVRYPVLRLTFGGGNYGQPGQVEAHLTEQLAAVERRAGLVSQYATVPGRFAADLEALHDTIGQPVAVLVDEYDKPILDALDAPDVARANRDFLRGVYAVIKDCDAHVRFAFVTGVSKFSKVSLFSGLNNLNDITLDPRYSTICGYTEADLDAVFAPELPGLDREKIRDWYDGYNWRGPEPVYNPYDILLLFDRREFKAHWFETGTPSFLVDTLFRRRVRAPALEAMVGTDELLSKFDVDDIGTEALLFQTGHLTIAGERNLAGKTLYRLRYPNREVKQSLNEHLLYAMGPDPSREGEQETRLYDLLAANDFAGLESLFRAFFAGIPYNWYVNNDIASFEGYYASLFYSSFAAIGLDVTAEDASSHGRLDMAVRFNGNVYLFEFKVVESAPTGTGMAQLKDRRYADKYRGRGEPIHLIAVEFSKQARNLAAFEVERA